MQISHLLFLTHLTYVSPGIEMKKKTNDKLPQSSARLPISCIEAFLTDLWPFSMSTWKMTHFT